MVERKYGFSVLVSCVLLVSQCWIAGTTTPALHSQVTDGTDTRSSTAGTGATVLEAPGGEGPDQYGVDCRLICRKVRVRLAFPNIR